MGLQHISCSTKLSMVFETHPLMEKGSELFDEVKELRRKRKEGLMKSMPSSKKSKGANLIGPW
jgi:hypothetical protein